MRYLSLCAFASRTVVRKGVEDGAGTCPFDIWAAALSEEASPNRHNTLTILSLLITNSYEFADNSDPFSLTRILAEFAI